MAGLEALLGERICLLLEERQLRNANLLALSRGEQSTGPLVPKAKLVATEDGARGALRNRRKKAIPTTTVNVVKYYKSE